MPQTNKNSRLLCRYLTAGELSSVHKTFLEAFSDYIIQFDLTEQQFRNHIILNAVELGRSAGCEADGNLIGVSLNGFGDWEGKKTVYDAGTGVIPQFRRLGASRAMFDWMIPMFVEDGYQQFLLEVITQNEPAIRLYKQLGFYVTRELLLLETEKIKSDDRPPPKGVEIREIHRHENIPYALFWDGKPSWQNSIEAVDRSLKLKRLFGAFDGDECVGYIVFSAGIARLAQLAVHREHRRKGIATHLLLEMQKHSTGDSMQVINLDESMTEAVVFFQNRGFRKRLAQFEMVLQMGSDE